MSDNMSTEPVSSVQPAAEPISSVQPAAQEPAPGDMGPVSSVQPAEPGSQLLATPVSSVQNTSIIVNPKTGEQFHIQSKRHFCFF